MFYRLFFLCLFLCSFLQLLVAECRTKFAICVCSYNNEQYIDWNLESLLFQNYDEEKFHIYYMNDMSTDATLAKAKAYVNQYHKEHLVTFIDNSVKKFVVGNHYDCIHNLIKDDQTVVLSVDGDDALANHDVLKYLDRIYSQDNPKIYLTYGQFKDLNGKYCVPVPERELQRHAFRKYKFVPSHLRTFYAWLFKKIRKCDLMYQDHFPQMAGDLAMMFPMMEMASGHFLFVPDILYLYNTGNPISDGTKNTHLQVVTAEYFRRCPRYEPLDPAVSKSISRYVQNAKLVSAK